MNYFKKTVFLLVFCAFSANFLVAQTLAQPRQEKLLNGLKILIFSDSKDEKVSLRLRIHSGSAFDPKDKMGVMALLSQILFPDEQTKIFFREDLQGSLDVTSNYDYIQINASGKPDEFLTILETVATAVNNPPITPENFTKVRDAQLKKVEELQKNPAYVADMAAAKRLLGDFPYGRPADGTPESLKLIDRADLLFAKDRFFTADNATLAISGNVKTDFAYMAARRLFGAWKKSDKLVPATFRQPDEPDEKPLVFESPTDFVDGVRTALRSLARNDKDFFASQIFVRILESRFLMNIHPENKQKFFVRQNAHVLPGFIVFGFTNSILPSNNSENAPVETNQKKSTNDIFAATVTIEEFTKAKSELLNEINKSSPVDMWLDVDTFKMKSVKDDLANLSGVTIADVQRISESLGKNRKVTVVMNSPLPRPTPQPKQNN